MSSTARSPGRWIVPAPRNARGELARLFSRNELWVRAILCLVATLFVYGLAGGWAPAFPFRERQHLARALSARVPFEIEDVEATRQARETARGKVACWYEHDARMLPDLRQAVLDAVFAVIEKPVDEVLAGGAWKAFWTAAPGTTELPADAADAASLDRFRAAFANDQQLEALRLAVNKAFVQYDQSGLLETLEHELGQGSMTEIRVFPKGDPEGSVVVPVSQVRIPEIAVELRQRIGDEIRREEGKIAEPEFVAGRLFDWLRPQLRKTLTWNQELTRKAADEAAEVVEIRVHKFLPGQQLVNAAADSREDSLIGGGEPLSDSDLRLLRAEHEALVSQMGWPGRLAHSLIFIGLFGSAFALIAGYLWHRDRSLLLDFGSFAAIVIAFTLTVAGLWVLSWDLRSRLEIIGIVLFAMTVAIAWHVELAVILGSLAALVFTIAHGFDLPQFVILSAAGSVAAMFCRSIRSRTKSVYIGLITAAVVFPVTLCSELLVAPRLSFDMLLDGLWYAGGASVAGLLMTALLPFLERYFGIETDISLLELSDPSQTLLRQLVQRAPGTYNHSISVASIAETAAETIGANGLLCRVGAYFHDIGKMRKPEYFVENQVAGENRHDDLVPTMSTLVIISHVKDGAEMARQHHLPQRIVDLIEQHHGTTVVEYFYLRAAEQSGEPNELDDFSFRYPGPRPQSAEAAVLMLADSVEGATRTLREPSPSRIESLVHSITRKKLDDGQFDECSLTLQQIRIIESSLIKSLNAMYHARVRYPEPAPA